MGSHDWECKYHFFPALLYLSDLERPAREILGGDELMRLLWAECKGTTLKEWWDGVGVGCVTVKELHGEGVGRGVG